MNLNYPNENILKKYNVKFSESINAPEYEEEKNELEIQIEIEYRGEQALFFIESEFEEEEGTLEKILESTNKIFNKIDYKLDKNGKIESVTNIEEIINNWEYLRKESFFKLKDENIKEFIFKLNRIINNKYKLMEMMKRFNVMPFIFLGIYNQEIKKSSPLRLKRKIYNIFPLINIPVQYEIYDESTEKEKIGRFLLKEDEAFERSEYIKQVSECYPMKSMHKIGSFDLKGEGYYSFDENDLLKVMELKLSIEVKNLIKYNCIYEIKER